MGQFGDTMSQGEGISQRNVWVFFAQDFIKDRSKTASVTGEVIPRLQVLGIYRIDSGSNYVFVVYTESVCVETCS